MALIFNLRAVRIFIDVCTMYLHYGGARGEKSDVLELAVAAMTLWHVRWQRVDGVGGFFFCLFRSNTSLTLSRSGDVLHTKYVSACYDVRST